MRVDIQIFGKPSIKVNGEYVEVSLKKSEAMMYYLACEKRVTREELVRLIWCDVDPQLAKKNLRNNLYRVKKDLGVDLIACPSKNVIEINSEVEFHCDINGDENYFLMHYRGKFIESFSIRESEGFEMWRQENEYTLNQKYLHLAGAKIKVLIEASALEDALQIANVMLKIDEFDERTTRHLMVIYSGLKQYKQIVEVYATLKKTLEEEMGILPDKVTRELYYNLIHSRAEAPEAVTNYFGRQSESMRIGETLNGFMQKGKSKAIVLVGEAGVGKSKLLDEILKPYEDGLKVIKMSCYRVEEGYAYKSWNEAFSEIAEMSSFKSLELSPSVKLVLSKVFPSFMNFSDEMYVENIETINADYLEKLVCKLLSEIGKKQRIIFFIDDLQWMDEAGVRLLLSVMLHVDNITFVATLRNEYASRVDGLIAQLSRSNKLDMLPIERFTKEETFAFMDYLSPNTLGVEEKNKIFDESEGNAFFVVEGTAAFTHDNNTLKIRMKNILDSRFLGLSSESMKLLTLASMFFDELEFKLLTKLYANDEDQILESLQELKHRYLIKEIESDEDIKIKFTHNKLREHVYENTPMSKRRILHNRIASALEDRLKGDSRDVLIYQKLIYHFQSSGNVEKHLYYYLKYLKNYFDFSHELYPDIVFSSSSVLEKSPMLYFDELDSLFDKLSESVGKALRISYTHMKGRYLIRQGDYIEGMKCIEWLIDLCKEVGDNEMLFKGYVQWIYYLIQTEQPEIMQNVLSIAWKLEKSEKNKGVLLRLSGIGALMLGQYDDARKSFEESIEQFKKIGKERQYVLSIAAAFNYISETYRRENKMDLALEYVQKAIEICKAHNIIRGSSVFNTNAGIIAYNFMNYEKSKKYFEEALTNFESIDTLWRRSEAEGYLGLILIEEGNFVDGWTLFNKAKKHAGVIGTPETLLLLEKLEIRAKNRYDESNIKIKNVMKGENL